MGIFHEFIYLSLELHEKCHYLQNYHSKKRSTQCIILLLFLLFSQMKIKNHKIQTDLDLDPTKMTGSATLAITWQLWHSRAQTLLHRAAHQVRRGQKWSRLKDFGLTIHSFWQSADSFFFEQKVIYVQEVVTRPRILNRTILSN